MLQFKPKNESDLVQIIPKGDYDFDVVGAEDTVSKECNPMVKIKLGIYNGEAVRWYRTDYLLPAMEAKLRHFCDTTGLLAKYEDGSLCAEDCKGRSGRLRIGLEKDKTGQYPDKDKVADYVCRVAKPLTAATAPAPAPAAKVPGDDDVPF